MEIAQTISSGVFPVRVPRVKAIGGEPQRPRASICLSLLKIKSGQFYFWEKSRGFERLPLSDLVGCAYNFSDSVFVTCHLCSFSFFFIFSLLTIFFVGRPTV